MTKEQLMEMFETDNFQSKLEFTTNIEEAIESILNPHEDCFLELHNKVRKMIEREIKDRTDSSILQIIVPESTYLITFADICNLQKELFEHKKEIIRYSLLSHSQSYYSEGQFISDDDTDYWKINNLPNQHINLGLRQKEVTVSGRKCPHPMLLEELKELCFPIDIQWGLFKRNSIDYYHQLHLGNRFVWFESAYVDTENFDNPIIDKINLEDSLLNELTNWYKLFNQIHFFEDLNGRLGGIVVNILSHILTGKYVTINY
jgi:hypothetical protein